MTLFTIRYLSELSTLLLLKRETLQVNYPSPLTDLHQNKDVYKRQVHNGTIGQPYAYPVSGRFKTVTRPDEDRAGSHCVSKIRACLTTQHFGTNKDLINGFKSWLGPLAATIFNEGTRKRGANYVSGGMSVVIM